MLEDDISGRTITGVWAGDSVPALTLPQPHFVPAGTKGSLWNSSFKDFLGFSAVINGSDALSVYVIVTQLHGLQKYSCGHKLYHLKIWNNRSKFEYMGYQSLQKHSSKRAVEWNSAGDRFQDHSFIQGGGTIPWAEHSKCHNKPPAGPTPFPRCWNQPGPCCHSLSFASPEVLSSEDYLELPCECHIYLWWHKVLQVIYRS